MIQIHKVFPIFLIIFTLLVPTLALSQSRQAEKNWLFAYDTDQKLNKFVGVMVNEVTCQAIVQALNEWASAPPLTPLKFHCEAEPKKA